MDVTNNNKLETTANATLPFQEFFVIVGMFAALVSCLPFSSAYRGLGRRGSSVSRDAQILFSPATTCNLFGVS